MTGREVEIDWRGRRGRAWLPEPWTAREGELDELSEATVRATERAAAAAERSDDRATAGLEAVGRLLLRAEGIASSNIEGLRVPVEEVAAAQLEGRAEGTAAWIADNLDIVGDAIRDDDEPLTVQRLHDWHRRLMRHGHLEEDLVGTFRDRLGWIGGTTPLGAVYVPPPPDALPSLVDDLVTLANRTDLDPIAQAAVVHAQFEAIHPYGDGNGRIGRVLIGWLLVRRLGLRGSPPPVSVLLARDPGGYLSGLTRFRIEGAGPWVRWFAGVVERSASATAELHGALDELLARWGSELADLRSDATALRLLSLLPAEPVLHAGVVADRLSVSERAALGALEVLAERGVVTPFDPPVRERGRPRRWFSCPTVVELIASWPG